MPGPPPKREAERRRRNKDATEVISVDLSETLAQAVEIPPVPMKTHDEDGEELAEPESVWHPIAERWYLSLTKSGQSIFYEPSDWSTAYLLADQIHRALQAVPVQSGTDENGNPTFSWRPMPMPGATLSAMLKAMSSLMTTEGDRRRLRIELDRAKIREAADDGKVIPISTQRAGKFKDAR